MEAAGQLVERQRLTHIENLDTNHHVGRIEIHQDALAELDGADDGHFGEPDVGRVEFTIQLDDDGHVRSSTSAHATELIMTGDCSSTKPGETVHTFRH